ncbi:hypothetical protein [Erwinia aphidicola]|uniref:hypothetical protein n=1 Tax=Erwinia aphidicola TaxID=68334 RepID=UPI0030CAF5DB
MNKKQLAILERAWGAEISCALNEIPLPMIQTRSKVAKQLTDDGYQINHAGIHAYCESIPEDFDIEAAEAEMRAGQVKS